MAMGFKQITCLVFVLSTNAMAHSVMPKQAESGDFSRSYQIWSQRSEGRCGYIVGDIYIKGSQLQSALTTEIHKENGIEFLTTPDTPSKCIDKIRRASKRAGFISFRFRLSNSKDRDTNLPPHS